MYQEPPFIYRRSLHAERFVSKNLFHNGMHGYAENTGSLPD
jgi:hypothetical protein